MGKYGKKKSIDMNPLHYNICLLGESGIGKEQPISEPVLTEDGWVNMGDIKVGTKVFGEDGKLHNVIGVYPQGIKDVYEVTFRDGTKTRCGLDHLWTVSTTKQRENMRKHHDYRFKVLPLKEIMKNYRTERRAFIKKGQGRYQYKYSVPINDPIEFGIYKDSDLKIDPYILGLLLGDGGFTGNVITFTNSEEELFEHLSSWCDLKGLEIRTKNFDNHKQGEICIKNESNATKNYLKEALSEIDLNRCGSREKFMPKEYLYSSIENRRKLLSGLINTDGHVTDESIVYSSYSSKLAQDVAELARSLGFICRISSYDRTDENSTKKYEKEIEYRVSIIGNDYSALALSSKHRSKLQKKHTEYVKSITNIELVGKEESQCIMLDSPSGLYITRDYIVTHNTTIVKEMCETLVGDEGYIHFDIGREAGAEAIEGIVTEKIENWDKLCDVVDDIIENKETDYPDLKTVIWDTLDEVIPIVEAQVIKQHNRGKSPNEKIDTINAAKGGFGKGQEAAIDLFIEKMYELSQAGVYSIIIGHVKRTDMIDPITQKTYSKLTSDTTQKYFNAIKNKMHFVGVAYIDRNIETESTGRKNIVNKEDITINRAKDEKRMIGFRDDSYSVDSKSRFACIVDKIPFDKDAFIKAMQDAIIAEKTKSGKSEDEVKAEQAKREEQLKSQNEEYIQSFKKNRIDVEANMNLMDIIEAKFPEASSDNKKRVKEVMGAYDFKNFKEPETIPTTALEEIVTILTKE